MTASRIVEAWRWRQACRIRLRAAEQELAAAREAMAIADAALGAVVDDGLRLARPIVELAETEEVDPED